MHRLRLHLLALGFAILVVAAAPAFAQTVPKVELSGGYQFLNFSVEGEGESMPVGWYFDVAGNLTPMLGIVFQMGGNYKSIDESVTVGGITVAAEADLKVHEFLGGVRLNLRSDSPIVPFAQVLAGAINGSADVTASTTIPGMPPITIDDEASGTNFALQVGGGVNFTLSDAVGLRVGADYLRAFEEDAGANLFRFAVGVVIGR
jgi:opacity protein-like surface antigen